MANNSSCSASGCSRESCEGCPSAQGGPQDLRAPMNAHSHVKHVIGVISGKGGVGKSSVTAMLAVYLRRQGYRVGVLDADITGPSIPHLFGAERIGGVKDEEMYPAETVTGIRIMSINLLLEDEGQPVLWRGPILGNVLQQFWSEVVWGELDYLLEQLCREARARDMRSMAVTFDRHPREVVQEGWHPLLLTTLDEKCTLLAETGIDTLVVLRFDEAMAALTARRFMDDVLRTKLNVELLLTGYDNRFGHDRRETFDDYVRYGREMGIEVVCAEALRADTGAVPALREGREDSSCDVGRAFSSSLVRRLLAEGDVGEAARCLGRCYTIQGRVVHGERKGHDLGFPTANLQPCDPQKLIPARGAYAVEAILADGTRHHAMTNIGMRPTFNGEQQTLETNIFDIAADLYGQPLVLSFVARLRDEVLFPSPEALAAQLSLDCQKAKQILSNLNL